MRFESEDSASRPVDETTPTAGPTGRSGALMVLAVRMVRLLATLPAIGAGVVVAVVGFVLVERTAPCSDFHFGAQFSGSDDRLGRWIGSCGTDLGAARSTLLADGMLIAGYAIAATGVLARWWPLLHAERLKKLRPLVVLLPVIAAALDVAENVSIWAVLGTNGRRYSYPHNLAGPTLISMLAWMKMLVFGVGVLCLAGVVMLAIARRRDEESAKAAKIPDVVMSELGGPSDLGVCCSGGGIRAAAFALGAIESLEERVLPRARWLTAVSGGNYAATAWTLAKASAPDRPAANDIIGWLNSPIPYAKSRRHRFLRNGPGGLGRSIIAAVSYIALNVALLGALVAAIAWPIGRLIGTKAIQPQFHALHGIPARLVVGRELWLPGAVVLGLAAVVFLVSALPSWRLASLWRVAAVLVAIGLALELLTVGIPGAIHFVGNWVHRGDGTGRARGTGLAALLGGLGAVWQVARTPVLNRVSAKLPYLGGVLLAFAALVWAGKVAADAATGTGLLPRTSIWLLVVCGFAVVYLFGGMTQPSIHRIYSKRLRRTFGVQRDEQGRLWSPVPGDQLTWGDLPDTRPELVVCCAHQRDGIAPGGLPADTFTISRNEVRIGGYVTPTECYLARLPDDLASERRVASWMATSGAAFASAMGRMSRGTTNALMAALNIDLGIWLPNPRLTSNPDVNFPKVRFGYLFKEILGWYDENDRYVFVADGGHWDNLGLVELLRRRCQTIICLDASGDDLGRFTTVHQAVELAGLELPETVASIELDSLSELVGDDGALPKCSVAALRVNYTSPRPEAVTNAAAPGPVGTILYAKAQLAADLDVTLRRFAKADPTFPNYSTARLFLRDEQFRNLVDLGRAAGRRLRVLYDSLGADEATEATEATEADTGTPVITARARGASAFEPA